MSFPPFDMDFVNAVHHAEQGRVYEQQVQATSVAMGTLDEYQVSGIVALALAKLKSGGRGSLSGKREQSTRDLLQQALLDYIDDLNQDIALLQTGFEAQFGDAWREEIALRVFGPDEIPQQREGESIEKYRKRLEKELVAKMLNPDGTAKDEYLNDPNLRKYAEWAQKIRNRDVAQALANKLSDPSTTPQQGQEIMQRIEIERNSELINSVADALEGQEDQKSQVLVKDDSLDDASGLSEQSRFAQDFAKPIT